jgi:hypothetical protein
MEKEITPVLLKLRAELKTEEASKINGEEQQEQ